MTLVSSQYVVEQLCNGIGDREEEDHEAENEWCTCSSYLQTISDTHLMSSALIPSQGNIAAHGLRYDLAKDDNHGG